jgi:hypothetical protein
MNTPHHQGFPKSFGIVCLQKPDKCRCRKFAQDVCYASSEQVFCQGNPGATQMQITKDTRVSDILLHYGDIAEVMEVFGVKRVGRYSLRMFLAKALTVEWAARAHRVPLDEFLEILQQAVRSKQRVS